MDIEQTQEESEEEQVFNIEQTQWESGQVEEKKDEEQPLNFQQFFKNFNSSEFLNNILYSIKKILKDTEQNSGTFKFLNELEKKKHSRISG